MRKVISTPPFYLGASILLVQAAVLGFAGTLLVRMFSDNLEYELLSRLKAPGQLMQSGGLSLNASGNPSIMQPLVGDVLVRSLLLGVNGVVLHSMDAKEIGLPGTKVTGLAEAALRPVRDQPHILWPEAGDDLLRVVSPITLDPSGVPLFYLYIEADAHGLADARRQALINVGLAIAVVAICSTVIISLVMRRSLLLPVRHLKSTVQKIGRGELDVRCHSDLPGELGELGRGLNAMAASLSASDHAMRQLNTELEARYEERTRDLKRELAIRVETERQLRDARDQAQEALLAKSRFLASASHDLRQPVHALRLLLSAAEGLRPGAGGEFDLFLGEMKDSIANLADQLNALLDVSRLEAGAIIPSVRDIGLGAVLRDLQLQFQREAALADVRLHVVATSCIVRTDPVLLRRVLVNLISNAIKFAEGGAVVIGVRRRGADLHILVCDTGKGIPEESLDLIFEEFRQIGNDARQKSKGLGLGLSIVRRLCALLAHPLQVLSRVGHGTTFSVVVPLIGSAVASRGVEAAVAAPLLQGRRILLIEDDPAVTRAMEALLGRWGAVVEAHEDGASALADSMDAPPDLLITDYNLPGGMTGLDLVRALRARTRTLVPAILVSGQAQLPDTAGIDRLGVLGKPVDTDMLKRMLASMFLSR